MTERDAYAPPGATVADVQPIAGSLVSGLVIGACIAILGTLASRFVIVTAYMAWIFSQGGPTSPEQLANSVAQATMLKNALQTLGIVFGAIGGYVCARMARRPGWRAGAMLAAIVLVIGLVTSTASVVLAFAHQPDSDDLPRYVVLQVALLIGGAVAVLVGFALGNRTVQRKARATANPPS